MPLPKSSSWPSSGITFLRTESRLYRPLFESNVFQCASLLHSYNFEVLGTLFSLVSSPLNLAGSRVTHSSSSSCVPA